MVWLRCETHWVCTLYQSTKSNHYVCFIDDGRALYSERHEPKRRRRTIVATQEAATLIAYLRSPSVLEGLFSESPLITTSWLVVLKAVVVVMRAADGQSIDERVLAS